MDDSRKREYLRILQEKKLSGQARLIDTYFPDTGPLRRELYSKHMEFFRLGTEYPERLALAANRVGKTETMGGYEVACHLTGQYPTWWPGRRFDHPTEFWAAGKDGMTVRDIIQLKLMGPKNNLGSGLLKKELIVDTTPRRGTPDAFEKIFVKHVSGGISELQLKAYDQGRQSFEGTKKHGIWLDEECPLDVYTECLLRTMDTTGRGQNGMVIVTFTPLLGMSELVLQFLPNGQISEVQQDTKAVIMATWDDVPHLNDKQKAQMLASIPPFQRDARSKGIPQLGSGAIYPVAESEFVVDDFKIPDHWPKVYALDVGWNRTAALWLATDREQDKSYLYSEHYQGHAEPSVHAHAIKSRGDWISGVIDPAARGRAQRDGQALMDSYRDLGLKLEPAFNGVESGIYEVWQRLSGGNLKVFKSLQNWRNEFRLYRRDERGHIVKTNDHLMDDTRYLIMSGLDKARVKPVREKKHEFATAGPNNGSWMG